MSGMAVDLAIKAAKPLVANKKLLAWLVSQPEAAAADLTSALSEFRRSIEAVRDALTSLWRLNRRARELADREAALQAIADGQLSIDVVRAKGSCARIGRIYDVYLDGWFSNVLNQRDQAEFHRTLVELRDSDGKVVAAIEQPASEANQVAKFVEECLGANDHGAITKTLRKYEKEYRPRIRQVNKLLAYMYSQEARFYDHAKLT